jgi:hypothetical protein
VYIEDSKYHTVNFIKTKIEKCCRKAIKWVMKEGLHQAAYPDQYVWEHWSWNLAYLDWSWVENSQKSAVFGLPSGAS